MDEATLEFPHMFAAESKVATAPVGDEAKSAKVNSWKQIIDPVETHSAAIFA